jgi:hypothetical protein
MTNLLNLTHTTRESYVTAAEKERAPGEVYELKGGRRYYLWQRGIVPKPPTRHPARAERSIPSRHPDILRGLQKELSYFSELARQRLCPSISEAQHVD